jgi:hypothetical protein
MDFYRNGVFTGKRAKKGPAQEKADILAGDFKKLEENGKDYILDLTRKLAEIHYKVEGRR